MTRKTKLDRFVVTLFAGLLWWASATIPASAQLPMDQLEKVCSPIALYPDPLLSNVLAAATYPAEVSAAASWAASYGGAIPPDQVDALTAGQNWDPSVRALLAFPQVLNMMANDIQWTTDLGNAFLVQQQDLFNAIQNLRAAAQSAGNLVSTPQQTVAADDGSIVIEPANPDEIYVPSYDPSVVYYYYSPGSLLAFGLGVVVGQSLWFGVCDWHYHHCYFGRGYNYYYAPGAMYRGYNVAALRDRVRNGSGAWRFNSMHRRGLAVPSVTQINQARGFGNYRLPNARANFPGRIPNRSVAPASRVPTKPGPGHPVAPAGRVPTRPATPAFHPAPAARRPNSYTRPAAPSMRPAPAAPVQRPYPSVFNPGQGSTVNQDGARGARSRNVPNPTPVRAVPPPAYHPAPAPHFQAPPRPAPPSRPAPQPRPAPQARPQPSRPRR